MGCVYFIRNRINDKVYVGKTKHTVARRWRGHLGAARTGVRYPLYAAIRKHGEASFFVEEVAQSDCDETLKHWEVECIAKFNARDRETGYNIAEGGVGYTDWLPESRTKMSASSKKLWESTERRERQSTIQKKVWESTERREKQSVIQKKVWDKPETRANHSARVRNPEYRKRRASSAKRTWADPKVRAMRVAGMQKAGKNPERRAKTAADARKNWADPTYREKIVGSVTKAWTDPNSSFNSPEHRAKLSKAAKRRYAKKLRHRRWRRKMKAEMKAAGVVGVSVANWHSYKMGRMALPGYPASYQPLIQAHG